MAGAACSMQDGQGSKRANTLNLRERLEHRGQIVESRYDHHGN